MRITFLGGADEIGASAAVLETAGQRILIDAGIRMNERSGRPKVPDFSQLGQIDAVCLTHAHTDHSGALPVVNRLTRSVPVFMTNGSFHLCTVLFRDALKLMSMFPEEYEIPLYGEQDVLALLNNIRMVSFGQAFMPVRDVRATFFPAGHILGAGCLLFESSEGSVLFTGDFSVTPQLAVSGVSVNTAPDVVVTESTYGNRVHQPRKQVAYECLKRMQPILERGGKILIPAFAIGRSQEMILLLKDAVSRKVIPDVDIFVDGMINAVNQVYESQPQLLPPGLRRIIRNKQSLFYTGHIRRALMPRKLILTRSGPAVIIASSGMLVGGPSSYYAQELLKHAQNALFISGYQDEESPGRRLLELQTGDDLTIDHTNVTVQAEICKFSFSAHADSRQIREFVSTLGPRELVLTHGDHEARSDLQTGWNIPVHLPNLGDTVEFSFYRSARLRFTAAEQVQPVVTLETYWDSCFKEGVQQVLKKEVEDTVGAAPEEIESFDGFRPDYRDPHVYAVLSPAKRRRYRERRQRFEAYGDLCGRVVLYGTQNRCHLACCQEALNEHLAWQAFSVKKGSAVTRIDPAEILYVLPDLTMSGLSKEEIRAGLLNLRDKAKPLIKPYRRILLQGPAKFTLAEARTLVGGNGTVEDTALISALTPIAARQDDGCYYLHQKAEESEPAVPVRPDTDLKTDFNSLQPRILQALQAYSLKKAGFHDPEIMLHFDFPDAVDKKAVLQILADIVPKELTVRISPKVNYAAFNKLLFPYTGPDGKLSFYSEKRKVCLRSPVKLPSKDFQQQFLQQTGFVLDYEEEKKGGSGVDFNILQPRIRQALQSYPLKKVGFRDPEIILYFDFPDAVDEKAVLRLLTHLVPEPLTVTISPKVDHTAFKVLLFPYIGPDSKFSVYAEKKQICLRNPVEMPSGAFQKRFLQQTGFTLKTDFE